MGFPVPFGRWLRGRFWPVVGAWLLVVLMGLALIIPAHAAEKHQSRLGRLVLNRNMLYLPARLVLGEENRFMVKAPPGSRVIMFLSPQPSGFTLPDGQSLRVGSDHEKIQGVVSEKGVLEISLPVPDEKDWIGRKLYVDAVLVPPGMGEDAMVSNLEVLQLVSAEGYRTENNALTLTPPADGGHMLVMPSMPGMDPTVINRLQDYSAAMRGDEKKKQLLDVGDINRNAEIDQNSLINRPGYLGN